jgi:DNA ligase 1
MVRVNTMTTDYNSPQFEGIKLAADWIRDLESSDSRLHKESVIEKALMAAKLGSSNAQCFLFNCYQAYNPYYVFGVKKVPETNGLENKENPWPKFWAMLEGLRTRTLTGHNAKTVIEFMSEQFDSIEWNNLCRRVIIKDLRCGITERTLNKVLGNTEWRIPVFECQLATDSEKHLGKMIGKKRIEQKLDGVRVLAVLTRNTTNLYSRNGKPFENFPHIIEQLDAIKSKLIGVTYKKGIVLDGEIIGESFQALMKQAQRKSDVETTDMVYSVFDIITMDDFERGYWNAQQHKRLATLEENRGVFDSTDCVRIMDGIEVDLDTAEGHDVMRRYATDAVGAGFEGIMIKDMDAPYECRRSTFWMKWKPTITVDLNIVGFEEGTGRNAGRLGAIICEGVDNDRAIRVNVGSGLSDANRDEYWSARNELLGDVIEVEADAVTQNQDGTYSLRFPRFIRFRGFEPGEKL